MSSRAISNQPAHFAIIRRNCEPSEPSHGVYRCGTSIAPDVCAWFYSEIDAADYCAWRNSRIAHRPVRQNLSAHRIAMRAA
jgi:hypothetical protein